MLVDMERRTFNRRSTEVNVYLTNGETRCVSRGIATDISTNGIFLKTNPMHVPRHKCVKLMFALRTTESNVVQLRRVTAIVMRSQKDGVGMRFCARRKFSKARNRIRKESEPF